MIRNPFLRICPFSGRVSRQRRMAVLVLLCATAASAQSRIITTGEFAERDGLTRRATLVEQGIPVAPMPPHEAAALRIERTDGKPLAAFVEPEAGDENGKVRWVRVSALVDMPMMGRLTVRLVRGTSRAPQLHLSSSADAIDAETPHYRLSLRRPGSIELTSGGRTLIQGEWGIELVGDARSILWGAYYRAFEPRRIAVEQRTAHRATILLEGVILKGQRKAPGTLEEGSRFDCELRLHLNALTPEIRYEWRITNLTGVKTWLQRYALRLPLPKGATWDAHGRDRGILAIQSGRLGVTVDYIEDLGPGAGIEFAANAIVNGGLAAPRDGGFYAGEAPAIHRLFYHGMSRTFSGALVPGGTAEALAEARSSVDLVLPPQYYSDTGALPEAGDPVTFGEFAPAIQKSAEILLRTQWRGTLFWGEWYREWDETRNMGVQEASNGHSSLAPLYHYWRTGDARFLHCARRSAQYTWDVQLFKGKDNQGRMFHTRRHLFDELDWIHPRYQRATGGLIASHVFLNPVARREIIETIRSFREHMFDERGIPHGWDKAARRRTDREDGVDTANFMEALTYCYRETGDPRFLDWALQMSRWTAARWEEAGKRQGDDWNWNLTNYVLRGLVTLYETSKDPLVRDLAIQICRTTLGNSSQSMPDLKEGVGGAELHFVFYHAWISTRVAKFAPEGEELTAKLLHAVRREVARQRSDGYFSVEQTSGSGIPTRWTSYYEAKSLIAYVPVLSAHLAAFQKHSIQPSGRNGRNPGAPARPSADGRKKGL